MFEHDVGVFAGELSNAATEPTPFRFVLSVFVFPERVVLCAAIDDRFAAEVVQQRRTLRRGDDADRCATTVEHVLHSVAANSAGCAPDQHGVTLFHPGAVITDEHSIARRVAESVHRRFFPGEVTWLWHELVGLDH